MVCYIPVLYLLIGVLIKAQTTNPTVYCLLSTAFTAELAEACLLPLLLSLPKHACCLLPFLNQIYFINFII